MYVCMYACMHVFTRYETCVCMDRRIFTYANMYAPKYVLIYVYMYVLYVCLYVYEVRI